MLRKDHKCKYNLNNKNLVQTSHIRWIIIYMTCHISWIIRYDKIDHYEIHRCDEIRYI